MARGKTNLKPPEDLVPAGVEEWDRIVAAAKKTGHELKPADRSALLLYCRTWITNQEAFAKVKEFGAVIKWPNGLPGPSPHYKVFIETGKQLRGLLADLGCTPAARDFDKTTTLEEPGDLDI